MIEREQWVSETQLCRALGLSVDTLRPLIERLIKKGKIKKATPAATCGAACSSCQESERVYYQPIS